MKPFAPEVWHIGDVIRKLRLERGWTQEQLAERADVQQQTIRKIEEGITTNPKEKPTLENMAKVFEVTVSYFRDQVPVPPSKDEPPSPTLDPDEKYVLDVFRALREQGAGDTVLNMLRLVDPEGARSHERDGADDPRADITQTRRAK